MPTTSTRSASSTKSSMPSTTWSTEPSISASSKHHKSLPLAPIGMRSWPSSSQVMKGRYTLLEKKKQQLSLAGSASNLHQRVAELKSKRLENMKQEKVWKKHSLSSDKQMVPDNGTNDI